MNEAEEIVKFQNNMFRELSDDYVMGFVEGEGCFSVALRLYRDYVPRKTTKRLRREREAQIFQVKPSFRITLADKDSFVLEKIKDKFGFGKIYEQKKSVKNPQRQDIRQYTVQNFGDLFKLVKFFEKQTFFTSKGTDFKLWCQALKLIKSGKYKTTKGIRKICQLRDKMNRKKGKTHKRKTEEVERILENPPEYILGPFKQATEKQTYT